MTSDLPSLQELADLYVSNSYVKRRELLELHLRAIFYHVPELLTVLIRSYTPGYCDGDPCDHCHDCAVVMSDGIASKSDIGVHGFLCLYSKDGERLQGEELVSFVALSHEDQKASGAYVEGEDYYSSHSIAPWLFENFLPIRMRDDHSPYFECSSLPIAGDVTRILRGMNYLVEGLFKNGSEIRITCKEGLLSIESIHYDCGY